MGIPRRNLLRASGALLGALPLVYCRRDQPHAAKPAPGAGARARTQAAASSLGSLVPDPRRVVALPEGFRYRIIDRVGEIMSDGYRVPGCMDGMACFEGPDDSWILMRNHEQDYSNVSTSAYVDRSVPTQSYDPASIGGVTRLVLDSKTLARRSSNLVLTGTERNCAGGTSPWGWLSCEESTLDIAHDPRCTKPHGYVFLCPSSAEDLVDAQPIRGYGRFRHEAVVIDPATHIAYLTEDREDGCYYRFVPDDAAKPFAGKLQALSIVGRPGYDTSNQQGAKLKPGERMRVGWVDLDDTDAPADDLRLRARARGAAVVRRGEGAWFHEGSVYLTATAGGAAELGQLFRHRIAQSPAEESLELVFESTHPGELLHPDNLTLTPWGDVYFAEDNYSMRADHIKVLRSDGTLQDIARNMADPGEFAGVCFSPDARVMFVNIFESGLTLAIEGPFPRA